MYKLSSGWLELLTREHRAAPVPAAIAPVLLCSWMSWPPPLTTQLRTADGWRKGWGIWNFLLHAYCPAWYAWKNSGQKKGLMPYFEYSLELQVLVKLPGKPSPDMCCTRRMDWPRPLAPRHSGVGWTDSRMAGCCCPWGTGLLLRCGYGSLPVQHEDPGKHQACSTSRRAVLTQPKNLISGLAARLKPFLREPVLLALLFCGWSL